MEWTTELHHGSAYTIGIAGEGQQRKIPVTILRRDVKHAEDTTAALRQVEVEASHRLGEEGTSFLRHHATGRGPDVGETAASMSDMHPAFGRGVLGD
jgi:hypothetical protein